MANSRSFGHRSNSQYQPSRSMAAIEAVAQRIKDESIVQRPDDELRQWKLARKQNFEIPWRPLSLMAALCFAIASFVLPDSVNDALQ